MPLPCIAVGLPVRRPLAALSVSLALCAGSLQMAHAGTAIGLYNPFNHGAGASSGGSGGVNELDRNRVRTVHEQFFPSGVDNLEDTDYTAFAPFYANYRTGEGNVFLRNYWQLSNYPGYIRVYDNPYNRSLYRNVHISPDGRLPFTNTFRYFAPLEELSSGGNTVASSPGFTNSTGIANFSSGTVDTGVGSASGSVSANGEIKLKVDVRRSGFMQTPVAEGALQGTYTDSFKVNGPAPTAATQVSFAARAGIPVLDFAKGDYFNYALGYHASIYEVRDEGGRRVTYEHWSASDLYWVEARKTNRDGFGIPRSIRIETIGHEPPDQTGVTRSTVLLDRLDDDSGSHPLYLHVQEMPFDPQNPRTYTEPLMPFESRTTSGETVIDVLTGLSVKTPDVVLPTGVDLQLMVNFFVVAGCSDEGFQACEFSIDGSQTAGLGIRFDDPSVSMSSASGFVLPQTALVPEPQTYALMLSGLGLLALGTKRRGRQHARCS